MYRVGVQYKETLGQLGYKKGELNIPLTQILQDTCLKSEMLISVQGNDDNVFQMSRCLYIHVWRLVVREPHVRSSIVHP